jgi:hypothetical protein
MGRGACPQCGSDDVTVSRRREILDYLILPFLLLRPFRCGECNYRYYGFFFRKAAQTGRQVSDVSADDVEWEIEPLDHDGQAWGFNVRYCLSRAKNGTTYYTFPETFSTKQTMMDCALKVAPQYLENHLPLILSALAD